MCSDKMYSDKMCSDNKHRDAWIGACGSEPVARGIGNSLNTLSQNRFDKTDTIASKVPRKVAHHFHLTLAPFYVPLFLRFRQG